MNTVGKQGPAPAEDASDYLQGDQYGVYRDAGDRYIPAGFDAVAVMVVAVAAHDILSTEPQGSRGRQAE